jgi:hypothetical protein
LSFAFQNASATGLPNLIGPRAASAQIKPQLVENSVRGCTIADVSWFSVSVETRGDDPLGMTEDEFGERLGDLVVALEPYHGVVTGGSDPVRWGARISIELATPTGGATEAAAIIRRVAAEVFLPDWPVVRVEAVCEDVLDEELDCGAQGGYLRSRRETC